MLFKPPNSLFSLLCFAPLVSIAARQRADVERHLPCLRPWLSILPWGSSLEILAIELASVVFSVTVIYTYFGGWKNGRKDDWEELIIEMVGRRESWWIAPLLILQIPGLRASFVLSCSWIAGDVEWIWSYYMSRWSASYITCFSTMSPCSRIRRLSALCTWLSCVGSGHWCIGSRNIALMTRI